MAASVRHRDIRRGRGHRFMAVAGIVAITLAAACGTSSEEEVAIPTPPGPAPIPDLTITINDLNYSAIPAITPGATITVVNNDAIQHSVTSRRPGLFDHEVQPGRTITFTAPTEIGSHPFHCRYHAFMEGWLSIRQ
ncbi:cupredoxin domain-containing protein [Nocardia sp. NPDC050710]|uniref:cupredoxin domain-containing protein n=1 Tax=Nocardia sp. NPDC050710 TaxID=3157220 RepID=UPI0033CA3B2F